MSYLQPWSACLQKICSVSWNYFDQDKTLMVVVVAVVEVAKVKATVISRKLS